MNITYITSVNRKDHSAFDIKIKNYDGVQHVTRDETDKPQRIGTFWYKVSDKEPLKSIHRVRDLEWDIVYHDEAALHFLLVNDVYVEPRNGEFVTHSDYGPFNFREIAVAMMQVQHETPH